MKISSPTNVTITSITAASGSSTHPSSTGVVPTWIQLKFTTSRTAYPCDHPLSTCPNAASATSSENPSDPIASPDESLFIGCFSSAITPAASIGTAGTSHSHCATPLAPSCGVNANPSCITPSSFHPVHLIQVGCLHMA